MIAQCVVPVQPAVMLDDWSNAEDCLLVASAHTVTLNSQFQVVVQVVYWLGSSSPIEERAVSACLSIIIVMQIRLPQAGGNGFVVREWHGQTLECPSLNQHRRIQRNVEDALELDVCSLSNWRVSL
jgi:hypothetical protein